MAVPASVAVDPTAAAHYQSPPRRRGSWTADRPGETLGRPGPDSPEPGSAALGSQGPDQGYAFKLAGRFEERLVLRPGEHAADVIAGACAVALRRASLQQRAPVSEDIEVALTVWGCLSGAPDELAQLRRALFAEMHHSPTGYAQARAIVACVPSSTLRMTAAAVGEAHAARWQDLLDL